MQSSRCLFLLLLLEISIGDIHAQEKIIVDTIRLPFEQLTINDGLSQGFVKAIAQDHDGFMWFGTKNGLDRYDGYHFTVFTHDPLDSFSIPEDYVTALYVDSRGLLWIGFATGNLAVFDPTSAKFFSLPQVARMRIPNAQYVNVIAEDPNHNIWFNTALGNLAELKPVIKDDDFIQQVKELQYIDMNENFALKTDVEYFCFDLGGRLWFAGNDSVYAINFGDSKSMLLRKSIESITHLPKGSLGLFEEDLKQNVIDVVTTTGIAAYDPSNDRVVMSQPMAFGDAFSIQSTYSFHSFSGCWFFSDLLYDFDAEDHQLHIVQFNPLKMQMNVLAIFEDRSGILWLGSNGEGIFKVNPRAGAFHQFAPANHLPSIHKLTVAHDGSVIVMSGPAYILRNENGREEVKDMLPEEFTSGISDLAQDTDRTYWFSLTNNSLLHYDPGKNRTWTFLNGRDDQTPGNLFPVCFDRQHRLWFGKVCNGVATFQHFDTRRNEVTDSLIFPANILPTNIFISQVYEDEKYFWFATIDGLFRYDLSGKSWKHYISAPADTTTISSDAVLSICPDPKQAVLWIGTEGRGLNRFDLKTEKFVHIGEKDGLPNNVVYGILSDEEGNLWMSTNRGIAWYNPEKKNFKSYVESDGLQGNEFNRFAFCKTPDGEFYFGGIKGINHFFPSEIKSNLLPPQINFTGIRIFNKNFIGGNTPVDANKKIILKYSQNVITIAFAAMDFTVPSKNEYEYKLEGFNHDWISNGTKNEVTFTNLDPGTYTFSVKAANSSGVWNEEGKSLTLVILPPWYMTWWFRIGLGVLVAVIVYAVYRYRINQLMKMQAVRNRIAGDLHDEIGSTLSSISIYSKVVQKRTKDKVPEAEPYLKRINSDIGAMMEAMSDIVWTINSSNDRFENIFSRMRSAAAELLEAKDYTLHFEFDEAMNDLKLDMEHRKNFYLIFKEALNNIAKYAEGKNVWITLSKNHSKAEMKIRDDGKGFVPGEKHGNGMNTMKMRAQKLNGKIKIETAQQRGTMITLLFPIT